MRAAHYYAAAGRRRIAQPPYDGNTEAFAPHFDGHWRHVSAVGRSTGTYVIRDDIMPDEGHETRSLIISSLMQLLKYNLIQLIISLR